MLKQWCGTAEIEPFYNLLNVRWIGSFSREQPLDMLPYPATLATMVPRKTEYIPELRYTLDAKPH